MAFSKTQIDRLGDRLKQGSPSESDLRLLDDYRRSFGEAYEAVVQKISQRGQFPTGRLAKSTLSIAEKLRRESIRLTQIQDIAGCRVVVPNTLDQDNFVSALREDFPGVSVVDRRDKPSFGYRAVHVIVVLMDKAVEVQVRTSLQHMWAEVSEKCSDVIDPAIKYGGGSSEWRGLLVSISASIAIYEQSGKDYHEAAADQQSLTASQELLEKEVGDLPKFFNIISREWKLQRDVKKTALRLTNLTLDIEKLRKSQETNQQMLIGNLGRIISLLDRLKEKSP